MLANTAAKGSIINLTKPRVGSDDKYRTES